MKHRPIEHSYWVVENKLLAGEYPGTKEPDASQKKVDALIHAGITLFIDLTEETEGLLPYSNFLTAHKGVVHRRFPICDVSIPRSKNMTIGILDAIDTEISNGGMVYVHCWGGVGRTGVIVGCWVARHYGDGTAALQRLRELWQHCPKSLNRQSPETREQERYIIGWKEARKAKQVDLRSLTERE